MHGAEVMQDIEAFILREKSAAMMQAPEDNRRCKDG
jgi:hypothetical protein